MKLWYTIFIATFAAVYGMLSFMLLGSWMHETVKALRDAHRRSLHRAGRAGALMGVTLFVSAAASLLITQVSQIFWP